MFSDVEIKLKKRNKILFSHHRTLVMWALDCAKLPLEQFEAKYPDEIRPRKCLELCEDWQGENQNAHSKTGYFRRTNHKSLLLVSQRWVIIK